MELAGNLYTLLSEKEDEEGLASFRLALNGEHFIYKAHFPGNPITPGVCIVQIAVELLSGHLGRKLSMKVVRNLKFVDILSPVKTPEVTFRVEKLAEDEDNLVHASLVAEENGNIFTKLSLILQNA